MSEGVTLVLMVGGWGNSDVEQLMRGAHQAAAQDLLRTAVGTGLVRRAVVATDDPAWGADLADLPVELDFDQPGGSFHFGQRLAGLIERFGGRRVLVTGGASAPLMTVSDWAEALSRLLDAEGLVVTNNVHSCDWVGFVPTGGVLSLLARQSSDNAVAWALTNDAGMELWSDAPSAATRFDLDTPVDLLMARYHPWIGLDLRQYLDDLDLDGSRVEAVLAEMGQDGGSLALIGRCSPAVWQALDEATRCWVRVFAEERGMRASGRQERREVRSLLADHVSLAGFEAFFDDLAGMVNGVLLDDRVLLASRGLWPSASDRYNSDLYRWARVQDAYLRQLTQAATTCRIPVVLGGHSVVAGGLLALIEVLRYRQGQL